MTHSEVVEPLVVASRSIAWLTSIFCEGERAAPTLCPSATLKPCARREALVKSAMDVVAAPARATPTIPTAVARWFMVPPLTCQTAYWDRRRG
ncbi:MAG: hypothetical protein R3B57_05790 [Phycisphaerales bacterium]